jgi:hypothetical protein
MRYQLTQFVAAARHLWRRITQPNARKVAMERITRGFVTR